MSIAFVLKTHTTDLIMDKMKAMSIATCNKRLSIASYCSIMKRNYKWRECSNYPERIREWNGKNSLDDGLINVPLA